MSEHQVRSYTLSDVAMGVFTKLYNKGPQQDDDLPSKVGMNELIALQLAKKDPKDSSRNLLTKLGEHEAGIYFTMLAVNAAKEGEPVTLEVAGKTLNVDIDPDDADPAGTVEFIQAEVLKGAGGEVQDEAEPA